MTPVKEPAEVQRIDRWLWCARLFKSRSLASQFVSEVGVRITRNGATQKVDKPAFGLRLGDTILYSREKAIRIIEVVQFALRRGPATEARALFKDLSPAPAKPQNQQSDFTPPQKRPNSNDRKALRSLKAQRRFGSDS